MLREYPNTDFHELNLDFILATYKDNQIALENTRKEFNEYKEKTDKLIADLNSRLDGFQVNAILPAINQLDSDCAHFTMYQKQIPVIDENGQMYGSSINVNDIMLKPRKPANNTIAIFDTNGNLVPLCLDDDNPVMTINDLNYVNRFSDVEGGGQNWIDYGNGFKIAYGHITINLDNLTAAGGVFRQNLTINSGFLHSFSRVPSLTFGAPNNLDKTCWIGGATVNQNGILRVSVFSYKNDALSDVVIPYIAMGY